MRSAVFVDRDGTLIAQVDDLIAATQLRVLKTVPEGIQVLNELGFLVIVITNQPVIGKGLITKTGVNKLHTILKNRLSKKGAVISAFYVCPHRYADNCICRKPKLALVTAAIKKYHIDRKHSFFIGDDLRDIETGKRAKIRTILVKTGDAGKNKTFFDVKPDLTVGNFLLAAQHIRHLQQNAPSS